MSYGYANYTSDAHYVFPNIALDELSRSALKGIRLFLTLMAIVCG